VIGYEFMLGRRPYVGKTRKDIRDMMFAKQVYIKKSDIPAGWSIEAADFINKVRGGNGSMLTWCVYSVYSGSLATGWACTGPAK
jgi:hypothetical protein